MAGIVNADLYGGVKSSLPGGAAGLLKGGAILPTNSVRLSNEIPLSLTAGVNADASNSSKGELTLVDVVAVGQKYALLTASANSPASALTPATATAASVGVASGSAVAANTSRRGLVLVNTSANRISLAFGAAAVLDSGITLLANGGTFTMDANTFTTAEVRAIASGAASNLAIQEFN